MISPIRMSSVVLVLLLAACAKPPAAPDTPAEAAAKPAETPAPDTGTASAETPLPDLPADGLRLPDMFDLPAERDFRASNPSQGSRLQPGGAAVTSRPPTDPPARVKAPESGD